MLRIFSNATQSEIGCYSAILTNGNSFSHPATVGSILGIFTAVALISSLATALYGTHIPTMRTHYAHSLSMFVIFAVYHHIFFTGALSVNWPSVLPAFWSNFAWAAGMIYTPAMQSSINEFVGNNRTNATLVGGAASTGPSSDGAGGGYTISAIYKRVTTEFTFKRAPEFLDDVLDLMESRSESLALQKRYLVNSTTGFIWYGAPVAPGLPLPGNYSGFAGTLSVDSIPASNAFLTGLIWVLIVILAVGGSLAVFKWILEGLSKANAIKEDRLELFRAYWKRYTILATLRILFISFFTMMFLTLFQFVFKGSAGVTAIAGIVFALLFLGLFCVARFVYYYRLRFGTYNIVPDRIHVERSKTLGCIPWIGFTRESRRSEKRQPRPAIGAMPGWKISYVSSDPQQLDVHEDEEFLVRFGWLSARFRKSRWWFFSFWLMYELVRAGFYGGAAGQPLVQVFGLLGIEFIALVLIIKMKPFEGQRLNLIMVYLLGFSKVITVALSSAFDARFGLPRIITTVVGIVIIVVQGLLTIGLLVAIILGAISSYMSVTRNRDDFHPKKWAGYRDRYLLHVDRAASDRPPTPPPPPEEPKAPYFSVSGMRRLPKIEDEDDDQFDAVPSAFGSRLSLAGAGPSGALATPASATRRASRTNSMRSTVSISNLPFGARPHRASWSSRDFGGWHESENRDSVAGRHGPLSMRSDASLRDSYQVQPARSRAPSRGNSVPLEVIKSRPTLPATSAPPVTMSPIPMSPVSPILESPAFVKGKERALGYFPGEG
jgi:hypothetical protein